MRALRSSAVLVMLVAVVTATAATLPACGSHGAGAPPPPDAGMVVPPPVPTGPPNISGVPQCRAPARPSSVAVVALVDAFPKLPALASPVGISQAPGDAAHFYVWQQGGQVVRIDAANPTAVSTVVDLATANKVVSGGEAGLLGLAFSPAWSANHTAYLSYTTPSAAPAGFDSVIARIASNDGGATFDLATLQVVLQFAQPYTNHNGGNILFGPDGYLYAGFGDGGSGNDPQNRAQDLTLLFGKMLRLDVDGQTTYAIPPGNPFANDATGKAKEIFAWGLRNPWRWSFDRATGDLWAGDVGQDRWEEIDQIKIGGNYGWKVYEGTHCSDGTTSCSLPGALPPVVDYGHASTGDPQPGIAVTGGYVYRGAGVPSLVGSYLFGDYGSGRVWRIVYDVAGKAQRELLLESGKNISSFGEDLAGEVYLVSYGDGRILKLVTGPTSPGAPFPQRLSATGCVDALHPWETTVGVMPYDVNMPLWSDGADKRRWLWLPVGGQVHIGSDGHWELPLGSVLIKEFSVAGKRVETRLLVHHDDGDWAGYSYEWLDDQSDALLLPSSKSRDLGGGKHWYYPSRSDCLQCHTQTAGRTLGLETAQMNREAPNGGGNQLAALDAVGAFDAPLPATLTAFAHADDLAAPLGDRARAYLHANCSFCHRMGGPGRVPPDWRFALSLAQTGACNVAPQDGDLGVAGAKLIVPGSPATSVTSVRMHALDAHRMPPLGTHVVDTSGAALVDDWIRSLTSCN